MPDTDAPERSLIALGDYCRPAAAPAHHAVERLGDRVRRLLGRDSADAVQDDRLRRERAVALQDSIPAPGFDGIVHALAASLHDWRADPSSASRIRVLVLPPCERQDLMRQVAGRHALAVLDPPPRHALNGGSRTPIAEPGGESDIVVVPRL